MKVAIRADGGSELGYGHLVRTGALATELRERNHSVIYLTSTGEAVREFFPSDIEVAELASPDDGIECARRLQSLTADAVVTDSYDVDHQYQKDLSEVIKTVAVFQASDEYTLSCDILINSHLFASKVEYEYLELEPIWCLGLDYLLLREEFNQLAQKEPQWREEPEKALIIMGGSDVSNTTPVAMQAFDGSNLTVDVVIGPGYTNPDEIERTTESVDCDFLLHNDPPNLAELMFNADFAVTALGTTTYELIMANTPIVGVVQAENQARTANEIEKRGLGLISNSPIDLRRNVKRYLCEKKLREEVFRQYQGLIDGKGSKRIVDMIE